MLINVLEYIHKTLLCLYTEKTQSHLINSLMFDTVVAENVYAQADTPKVCHTQIH